MNPFEHMEIALMLREEAQRHFEYWLTISFAFIAATFIGRSVLKPSFAIPFAALYLMTVSLLIARYAECGIAANKYLALAAEQGAEPVGSLELVAFLRISVFLLGTLLSLWFLYVNSKHGQGDA